MKDYKIGDVVHRLIKVPTLLNRFSLEDKEVEITEDKLLKYANENKKDFEDWLGKNYLQLNKLTNK